MSKLRQIIREEIIKESRKSVARDKVENLASNLLSHLNDPSFRNELYELSDTLEEHFPYIYSNSKKILVVYEHLCNMIKDFE